WVRTRNPSCRLLLRQPKLGDHRLAHLELLYLARHRHRKAIDELHIARDLVVRDLALAEIDDLIARKRDAGAGLYPGADLLAVFRIGHADHLHVLDLGMPEEVFLDLAWINVFP